MPVTQTFQTEPLPSTGQVTFFSVLGQTSKDLSDEHTLSSAVHWGAKKDPSLQKPEFGVTYTNFEGFSQMK